MVYDKQTKELLPGVQIYDGASAKGDVTNIDGKYHLDLPAGKYTLTVSYVGYATIKANIVIETGKTITKNFEMVTDVFGLGNVVVTPTFTERTVFDAPLSITDLNAK